MSDPRSCDLVLLPGGTPDRPVSVGLDRLGCPTSTPLKKPGHEATRDRMLSASRAQRHTPLRRHQPRIQLGTQAQCKHVAAATASK